MSMVETRPQALRARLDQLMLAYERRKPLTIDEFEAVAEASFRLGVHPDTETSAAFAHLYRGHRLDGANARYAYHLGRLYLVHGEFQRAAEWLQAALRRAPTNHRVWAHLSIALYGLNELTRGDSDYEPDALRMRADRILSAIKAGQDTLPPDLTSITPPSSQRAREEEAGRRADGRPDADAAEERDERPAELDLGQVSRLTRAGVSRWSGAHELVMEAGLRSRASATARDRLLPELAHVAELARARAGGVAAFAVLGVLWLVCGYPVGSVRKLREQMPDGDLPSLAMLDRVCELMELDDDGDLAAGLAESLREGAMPASLAATIHRERVLWRPLTLNDHGTTRAARRFARAAHAPADAEKDPAEARDLAERLDAVLRSFVPERRPASLGDAAPRAATEALGPADAIARLAELERIAETLGRLSTELLSIVKTDLATSIEAVAVADAAAYSRASADSKLLRSILGDIRNAAVRSRADLDELKNGVLRLKADELGDDFGGRVEQCENALAARTGTSNIGRALKKSDVRLLAAGEGLTCSEHEPSDRVARLEAELREIVAGTADDDPGETGEDDSGDHGAASPDGRPGETPASVAQLRGPEAVGASLRETTPEDERGDEQESARGPAAAPVEEPAGPAELVGRQLERLDGAVDQRFAEALETFAAYGANAATAPAIVALRRYVMAHQADALYRLGRKEDAQRVWYRMLSTDRLDVDVLRNLAVSHTQSDEISRAMSAWQSYLEALCFLDVAADDPRGHASERAQLHRVFAAAYASRSLASDYKEKDVDLSDIAAFLTSAGRVHAFSAHWRLAALNAALGYRSPTLVLGSSRSTDERSLSVALERQIEHAEDACRQLPRRVRSSFRALCVRSLNDAFEQARGVKGRKRDRYYPAEEEQHVAALKHIVFMKLRIRQALTDDVEWATGDASGNVLANLREIDAISLDTSDALVIQTLKSIGVTDDIETFVEQLSGLRELCASYAIRRIFDESATPRCTGERFGRVVASWAAGGVPETALDLLDDPQFLYSPTIQRAFELRNRDGELRQGDRRELEGAIAELRSVADSYPGVSGPPRLAADLLIRLGRGDDARTLLERVERTAFHPQAAKRARPLLILANVAEREFQRATEALRAELAAEPAGEDGLGLLQSTYRAWLSGEGEPPEPEEIRTDFDRWLAAAAAAGIDEDLRTRALAAKHELTAAAVVASCTDARGNLDDERLADAAGRERQADPDNVHLLYAEAKCAYKVCATLSQLGNSGEIGFAELRSQLESALARAESLARALVAASKPSDSWHEDAHRMLATIVKARKT